MDDAAFRSRQLYFHRPIEGDDDALEGQDTLHRHQRSCFGGQARTYHLDEACTGLTVGLQLVTKRHQFD
ncbi:hypothetical protein ACVWZ4_002865 [Bradyrhizobium sp. USDA 4472]